jgi:hypothetical protein
MKTYQWAAIAIASVMSCIGGAGRSLAAESYVLIKVADMDHRVDMQVMSATEFKELEKTLQLEKKLFPDVIRNATKAWREDDFNKGTAFPVSRLSPRCIMGSAERFPTREKADEQLNKYYERDAQKDARQREKAKPKALSDKDKKKEQDAIRAGKLIKDKLDDLLSEKAKAATAEEKKVEDAKPVDKADAMKAAAKAL